ncbi:uncharacterized protein BO96DRAFT_463059 [Aspergillus niger CBS 101883]|uniref:uncharacterized protein n=1 Tax=Aspergillus lacticoffeatus (strain CBS 101883) TaxID=1450533 RepID=UPI000D7F5BD5|nr:uncharacterized protein BO96DRAFT_463059 [Aspergillus niger CBS 101883]PYH60653.1 hypothetical protein BO96DRAFT_463059 [Aspergillus niger CBS 101883]
MSRNYYLSTPYPRTNIRPSKRAGKDHYSPLLIGAPCILTLLLAVCIAARRQRLDSGLAVSKPNSHACAKQQQPVVETIRPWTDYSAPPIHTAVDVDLTSSPMSLCRSAASSSGRSSQDSPEDYTVVDPDANQSDGDNLLGPKSPERLQAPAPSSRSHSVSPKRTSLNRKDREKTDTGNIGISARSCDARRSKADLQSAGLPKAGQKRGLRWDGYAKGENRNSRVAPLGLERGKEGTVLSIICPKQVHPGELTPEAVNLGPQSGHPSIYSIDEGKQKLAASLAWWDPLFCQPVEGEHNIVQATQTGGGGGRFRVSQHKTSRDYSEGEEGGGERIGKDPDLNLPSEIRAIPAWYRSPARGPGQAHGNHFTGRVDFPQKIVLGLGQWKRVTDKRVWMTSRNELEKFDRVEPTGILGNARCVSGQSRAPKSAGQGYGKATRQ